MHIINSGFTGPELKRIAFLRIIETGDIRMPLQAAVIKIHLRVKRDEVPVLRHGQRIDFNECRVLGHGQTDKPLDNADAFSHLLGRQPAAKEEGTGLKRPDMMPAVEADSKNLFRRLFRHSLDIHAAGGRSHDGKTSRGTVEHNRKIQFPFNIDSLADKHFVNLSALGAGLLCHKLHTDDGTGCGFHFLDRAAELHSAPLTPAAGMNLGFHDPDGAFQHLGHRTRLFRRFGQAAPLNRNRKVGKKFLCLVFVNVHAYSTFVFRRAVSAETGRGRNRLPRP